MVEGFKHTEVGLIPEDWDAAPITEVILDINGIKIGPFGSQLKKELLSKEGYKVYGQENVYENTMEVGSRYISREHFLKLSSCEIKSGDFLISMMGTIGKCMIVPEKFEQGIMDSHLIRLRLNSKKLDSELLLHFFSSNQLQLQVKKFSVGGIMDGLSSKIVKQLEIPLPPTKEEQTAIATALNDADALITALEKLIAKKKAIKQGAMQELLKPKEGWVEKPLTSVVDYIHGKAHEQHIDANGDYIVVNSKFISSDGTVVKYSNKNFCPARTGDILTVLSDLPNGKALAKCFLVPINDLYAVNQRICIWRSKGDFPLFLYYILNRNKYFLGLDDGISQTHILNHHIEKCLITIPDNPDEQKEIAEILSDMDNEIHELEQRLQKQKQIKQGMMQVLLTGKIRLK